MRINIDPLESQVMAGELTIRENVLKVLPKLTTFGPENVFWKACFYECFAALMITFWIPGVHAYICHICDAVK